MIVIWNIWYGESHMKFEHYLDGEGKYGMVNLFSWECPPNTFV